MNVLTDRERLTLRLRLAGMSFAQIAGFHYGRPYHAQTAWSTYHKALKKIDSHMRWREAVKRLGLKSGGAA